METRLVIEAVWSWPVVLLVAAGLPLLVLLTYPPRVRHLPKLSRRLLIGARLFAVALLLFAMFRPELQVTATDSKSGSLIILGDSSRSMTTPDGPGGITRRAGLIRTLENSADTLTTLRKRIDVRYFDFAGPMASAESPAAAAGGEQTAIGAALEQILKDAAGQRVLGIVLMTDGAQRALPPLDTDPRGTARRMGAMQMPVFPVPFGESAISQAGLDIAIEDLSVSPVTFEKNIVPVTARVRATGAQGQRFAVQLLVEDRLGRRPDESGEMKIAAAGIGVVPSVKLRPGGTDETIPVDLSFVPQLPGEYRVAVRVVPFEKEVRTTNNQRETLTTVLRGGVNVAYFDTRRDESRFLPEINAASQIQLDFFWIRTGAFAELTRIDDSVFDPGRYDVYLIGDVPAIALGESRLKKLKACVDAGSGLLMMGGVYSFGAGGYAGSPIEDVLPVRMSRLEVQGAGDVSADLHVDRDLKMLPTPDGTRHFIMRLSAEKNRERWLALPPLRGANRLERKNAFVEVLAESEDRVPLLFAAESGKARVLAFAGDTTWRWWMRDFKAEHQRFWRQVVLWLARKEQETEQPVWVRVDPRNFAPGSAVPIELGARGDDGSPVTDAQMQVRITDPNGAVSSVAPLRTGDSWSAAFQQSREPGLYQVAVSATRNGQPVGGEATARFLVESRDLELDDPAADPGLLRDLAAVTGGRVVTPEDLPKFLQEVLDKGLPSLEEKNITRIPLWDNWWYLTLFVAVMTVEWIERKRRGLV